MSELTETMVDEWLQHPVSKKLLKEYKERLDSTINVGHLDLSAQITDQCVVRQVAYAQGKAEVLGDLVYKHSFMWVCGLLADVEVSHEHNDSSTGVSRTRSL